MAFQMTVLMYEHIHYTMQFVSKSSLCSILQHAPHFSNLTNSITYHIPTNYSQHLYSTIPHRVHVISHLTPHISSILCHMIAHQLRWSGRTAKEDSHFLSGYSSPSQNDLLLLKSCQVSGGQNSPVDMANISKYPRNTFVLTSFRNFPLNPLSLTPDDLEEHQLTLEQIDEFRGVPTEKGEVKAKFPVIFSILSRSFCDLAPDISG